MGQPHPTHTSQSHPHVPRPPPNTHSFYALFVYKWKGSRSENAIAHTYFLWALLEQRAQDVEKARQLFREATTRYVPLLPSHLVGCVDGWMVRSVDRSISMRSRYARVRMFANVPSHLLSIPHPPIPQQVPDPRSAAAGVGALRVALRLHSGSPAPDRRRRRARPLPRARAQVEVVGRRALRRGGRRRMIASRRKERMDRRRLDVGRRAGSGVGWAGWDGFLV